jgi:hypothetical protein
MSDGFEPPAVAFLDILGFKELIARAETQEQEFEKLASLRSVVDDRVQFDNSNTRPYRDPV